MLDQQQALIFVYYLLDTKLYFYLKIVYSSDESCPEPVATYVT